MAEHLKAVFVGKEVDADFRRSSVWIGDWEVVKWDVDTAHVNGLDEWIQSSGIVIGGTENASPMTHPW